GKLYVADAIQRWVLHGSRGSAFAQGACCPNQKERGPVARSDLIPAETSEIFPSLGKSDIAAAHRAALRHLGNTPTRLRRTGCSPHQRWVGRTLAGASAFGGAGATFVCGGGP